MPAEQQHAQARYDDFKRLPLIGLGGATLLAAAAPMLLPQRGPRNAWGWVGGAIAGIAGAGLIGFGALKATNPSGQVLGALLISSGAVLIEIPVTQMVRAARE